MTGAHRIDIQRFHQAYIFYHRLTTDHVSSCSIVFMPVNAFKQDWLPIDQHIAAFKLTGSKADAAVNHLNNLVVGVQQLQFQLV